jgi:hypothetical protein
VFKKEKGKKEELVRKQEVACLTLDDSYRLNIYPIFPSN